MIFIYEYIEKKKNDPYGNYKPNKSINKIFAAQGPGDQPVRTERDAELSKGKITRKAGF